MGRLDFALEGGLLLAGVVMEGFLGEARLELDIEIWIYLKRKSGRRKFMYNSVSNRL